MIRLGLRLTLRGGREGRARFILTALGITVAVVLLLFTLSGFNALKAGDQREGWLLTSGQNRMPSVDETSSDPLWWRLSSDFFAGKPITVLKVAATGPRSPITPGLDRLPRVREYFASPALVGLLATTSEDLLGRRFPGRLAGTIGNQGLLSPDALTVVIGADPARLAEDPAALQVRSIETAPKEHDYTQLFQIILGIGAVGLLMPVLVFVVTSTRLAAARREERFAALRLVGATPAQVGMVASVEAGLAAVTGTLAGFSLFWILRPLVARIPFTGHPFFTGDLSLGWPVMAGVLIGVPVAAALASLLSLRRVNISPLGVSRLAPRRRPRVWRLMPLLAGLGALALPSSVAQPQTRTFTVVAVFALIIVGLTFAGPWITMIGARVLVRFARRDSTLIAARRLGDDPGRAFRAISGIVLAVFVGTVFAAVVGTAIREGSGSFRDSPLPPQTLVHPYYLEPDLLPGSDEGMALAEKVRALAGVEAVVPVWTPSAGLQDSNGAGLVARQDWTSLHADSSAPVSGDPMALDLFALGQGYVSPTEVPADGSSLRLAMLLVGTDGTQASVERARTLLETQMPSSPTPHSIAELNAGSQWLMTILGRMVTVGVILCLVIAGCSLAVSIAGGLVERKRPLGLLRLSGMPLRRLYRAVLLEAAVPLVLAALVSALVGFLVAGLILSSTSEGLSLGAPEWSYYAMMLGGILAALAVVGLTLPLLRRVTEPVSVRME